MNQDIIAQLTQVLRQRQGANADESYVASLYTKGTNKILEKVGEEATEVIIAAKDHAAGNGAASKDPAGTAKALTNEVADLWFHTLVMLVHQGIDPADVLTTLSDRFGLSGHDEKSQRGKTKD